MPEAAIESTCERHVSISARSNGSTTSAARRVAWSRTRRWPASSSGVSDPQDVGAVGEQHVDDGVGCEHAGGSDRDGSYTGDLTCLPVDRVSSPYGGEIDPDMDHRHRTRRQQRPLRPRVRLGFASPTGAAGGGLGGHGDESIGGIGLIRFTVSAVSGLGEHLGLERFQPGHEAGAIDGGGA